MSSTVLATTATNYIMNNPLQALSFIAAPALLTNACSLLVLSTSNRFARAVDRARLLAKQPPNDAGKALQRVERRALMIVRALIALYTGIGSFGISTFLGLVGSAGLTIGQLSDLGIFAEASLVFASIGVLCVATAGAHLVLETISAFQGLMQEATTISRGKLEEVKDL